MPDFPNELVEAAAKAYEDGWRESRGDHSVALGQSLAAVLPRIEQRVKEAGEPWSSLRKGEEAANLARYYAGLAGFTLAEYGDEKEVLRVFRTTGDARASDNPYPVDPFESGHSIRRAAWDVGYAAGVAAAEQRVIDRLAREAGSNPYTPAPAARHYDAQSDDVIRESAWDEGVACGVAAERARWEKLREALRILSDPDDPPFADWAFFHRAEDREEASQAFARAALAALAPERTTGEGT